MTDHEQLLTLLHGEDGVLETVLSGFRMYLEFCTHCVLVDYNIRDYSATEWCATELGPWASYVHTIHHNNAADIQKTWTKYHRYKAIASQTVDLSGKSGDGCRYGC